MIFSGFPWANHIYRRDIFQKSVLRYWLPYFMKVNRNLLGIRIEFHNIQKSIPFFESRGEAPFYRETASKILITYMLTCISMWRISNNEQRKYSGYCLLKIISAGQKKFLNLRLSHVPPFQQFWMKNFSLDQ